MIHSALLRLVAVVMGTTIAFGVAPAAQAKSNWQLNSVDQTVYQPNCISADCACDCRSERFCLPACMRW